MNRSLFGFLLMSILTLFVCRTSFAAAAYNERWTCLQSTVTAADKTIPAVTADDTRPLAYFRYTHSGILRVKGTKTDNPLPNSDTYIVECVQIPTTLPMYDDVKKEFGTTKEVCTTGNSATDMYIWNNDRLKTLQKIFSWYDNCNHWLPNGQTCQWKGYDPEGYFKLDVVTPILLFAGKSHGDLAIKTNAQGDFPTGPFIYSNVIIGAAERKFMAYNRFDKDAGIDVAGLGAQQQGKLEFDFEGANKNCVKIAWDPYGTIFDSYTLEPVPGVSVALYVKNQGTFRLITGSDVPGGFIQNPTTTKEDGYFSFIVPDGTYKLGIASAGYAFPSTQVTLPANASVIYSDFYRGEDIVQKGAMVHKDIPFDPVNTTSTQKFPAKIMGVFQNIVNSGETLIDGQVSHPFAQVTAYCKQLDGKKGSLNTTVRADKHGEFKLTFKPQLCDDNKGEMYAIVEVQATDLTRPLSFKTLFDKLYAWMLGKNEVEAALIPISYSFDPILTFVDGYAKDSSGAIIANASVGVYSPGDINPIQEVKADATGRFKLMSDQLPQGPYELRYKNATGITTKATTSKFITQNIDFIKRENVNLYAQKNTPTQITPTKTPSSLSSSNSSLSMATGNQSKTQLNRTTTSYSSSSYQKLVVGQTQDNGIKSQIIIMVLVMIFILGAGGMIFIYMMTKQNSTSKF